MESSRSFIADTWFYASRMRFFGKEDWRVYTLWIGLMLGLLGSVTGFLIFGALNGVSYPSFVWNVPIGIFIFVGAIAFDTIGHRTAYKEALKTGEDLVHHITIFAGITSVFLMCLAYSHREFLRIPTLVLLLLSVFYSVIDEAMHWQRYMKGNSDRIEMWSHFFIFLGHMIMIFSWWQWFEEGYPGVSDTIALL